jgi:hypothetical protein
VLALLGRIPGKHILVDLWRRDHCGSTALRFFHSLWKKARGHRGRLVFCNVSDHGQEIFQVSNMDGLGPICASREEALATVRGEFPTVRLLACQGPEVLLVDDDAVVRTLVVQILRRAAFTVQSAASGEEGIELYRERYPAIDVVLLDVQMPGLDDPATLAALREIDLEVKCCFMR